MGSEIQKNSLAPHAEHLSHLLHLPRGIARLEKLGKRKTVPRNQVLLAAGEKTKFCYIVKRGRVAAYEFTFSGEERIYNLNEENSVLLEANLLFDYASPVSFRALTECELVCIDKETLLSAVQSDPEISLDLMQSLATKFLSSMEQIRHEMFRNAPWKICDLLLIFAEQYGVPYDGKVLIKEKISQQMISNLLGMNRVTVVRAIRDLRERSLIEQINGFYCIRSMERLRRYQEELLSGSQE